jgi:hypothetical protein
LLRSTDTRPGIGWIRVPQASECPQLRAVKCMGQWIVTLIGHKTDETLFSNIAIFCRVTTFTQK